MARDVLNESKLTDEEIRLAEKVLACDHYTPSKLCALSYRLNQLVTERFICSTVLYTISLIATLIIEHTLLSAFELVQLIFWTYPVVYLMLYYLMDEKQVKIFMVWFRKIF